MSFLIKFIIIIVIIIIIITIIVSFIGKVIIVYINITVGTASGMWTKVLNIYVHIVFNNNIIRRRQSEYCRIIPLV